MGGKRDAEETLEIDMTQWLRRNSKVMDAEFGSIHESRE